jgi:hypothetical protein
MASLAERTASPWTATSMRYRPAGVLDLRQQPVRRCVWQWTVAGSRRRWFVGADRMAARIRRRAGDDGPRRHGATNTTLAATQRHPCRSGMVTADCVWSRSRPESVVASGALKDQRKIPASTIFLIHLRARGADDGGRRRRDASYGVARDSHRRKTRGLVTQPPCPSFCTRVSIQRTSTRQQLDCAATLLLRSQVNRQTPISDGLSACS